jgi:hypothetical protein
MQQLCCTGRKVMAQVDIVLPEKRPLAHKDPEGTYLRSYCGRIDAKMTVDLDRF